MTSSTVTRWLRALRKEGLVEVTEEAEKSPAVRYRRTGKTPLGSSDE